MESEDDEEDDLKKGTSELEIEESALLGRNMTSSSA